MYILAIISPEVTLETKPKMLILFESSTGYSLFRILDDTKLSNVKNIIAEFESPEKISNFIQLHAFEAFKDMDEARDAANCLKDTKVVHESLSTMIEKHIIEKGLDSKELAIIDPRLGGLLRDKFSLKLRTKIFP